MVLKERIGKKGDIRKGMWYNTMTQNVSSYLHVKKEENEKTMTIKIITKG